MFHFGTRFLLSYLHLPCLSPRRVDIYLGLVRAFDSNAIVVLEE